MSELAQLAVRGLAGGTLVVAFALIGEVVRPKSFSGIFSAAPSIALAGLLVTVAAKGTEDARDAALGMLVGTVAMVVYCVAAMLLLPRIPALFASLACWSLWLAVALGLGMVVL